MREGFGFAGPGASNDQKRPFSGRYCFFLCGVQSGKNVTHGSIVAYGCFGLACATISPVIACGTMNTGNSPTTVIDKLEALPFTFPAFATAFGALITVRFALETILLPVTQHAYTHVGIFYFAAHLALFFVLSFLLFLWLLSFFARTPPQKIIMPLLVGFCVILVPPLIDFFLISGVAEIKSAIIAYEFGGLPIVWKTVITFFGHDVSFGVTRGARLEIFLALIGLSSYVYAKTHAMWRTVIFALCAYALFVILATLPSLVTILVRGWGDFSSVTAATVVQFFSAPTSVLTHELKEFSTAFGLRMSLVLAIMCAPIAVGTWMRFSASALQHVRTASIFVGTAVVAVGTGVAIGLAVDTFVTLDLFDILALATLVCATASAAMGVSRHDAKTDETQQAHRTFFAASLVLAILAYPPFVLFILFYHAVQWLRFKPPFHAARLWGVSISFSALGLALLAFGGAMAVLGRDVFAVPRELSVLAVLAILAPAVMWAGWCVWTARATIVTSLTSLVRTHRIGASVMAFLFFLTPLIFVTGASHAGTVLLFASLAFWLVVTSSVRVARTAQHKMTFTLSVLALLYIAMLLFVL